MTSTQSRHEDFLGPLNVVSSLQSVYRACRFRVLVLLDRSRAASLHKAPEASLGMPRESSKTCPDDTKIGSGPMDALDSMHSAHRSNTSHGHKCSGPELSPWPSSGTDSTSTDAQTQLSTLTLRGDSDRKHSGSGASQPEIPAPPSTSVNSSRTDPGRTRTSSSGPFRLESHSEDAAQENAQPARQQKRAETSKGAGGQAAQMSGCEALWRRASGTAEGTWQRGSGGSNVVTGGPDASGAPRSEPWHVTGIFTSLQAIPDHRAMSTAFWHDVMFQDNGQVHSLEEADLLFKYGPWFTRKYKLNKSSCIGFGSTATVYSGEMDGKRVAFKVVNHCRTAPNASLFLDRSVLTELEVHHLLQRMLSPAVCKHLLVILDCQIYPPLHSVFAAIESMNTHNSQNSMPGLRTGAIEISSNSFTSEDGRLLDMSECPSSPSALELRFQLIMVSPLCELGGLLKLCQGKLNLPTRAVPLRALHDVIMRLSPRHYQNLVASVGIEVPATTDEDIKDSFPIELVAMHLVDKWGENHRAIMRSSQIPQHWQYLLKIQLLLQVCDGLSVLHRVGVVHCDVKLDNVFLAFDDSCRPFRITAKLGDLGMCRYVEGNTPQPTTSRAYPGTATNPDMLSAYTILVKGTPGYCAPEMLEFGRLSPTTDIYSMSVLTTLALAPESEFVLHEAWIMKLLPRLPPDMSPVLVHTLRKGLSFNKEDRPSLPELMHALKHEFTRVAQLVHIDPEDCGGLYIGNATRGQSASI